jgi:hypothetical protein
MYCLQNLVFKIQNRMMSSLAAELVENTSLFGASGVKLVLVPNWYQIPLFLNLVKCTDTKQSAVRSDCLVMDNFL